MKVRWGDAGRVCSGCRKGLRVKMSRGCFMNEALGGVRVHVVCMCVRGGRRGGWEGSSRQEGAAANGGEPTEDGARH